jgi:hypothetical protein
MLLGRVGGCWIFVVPIKFSLCSQYVAQITMCSQHVPQVNNVFPTMFPIALHFVPYVLPNVVLVEPI